MAERGHEMPKYVALLRGINVSGQKIIKMDHLRAIFESMNFQHVITYIQSGNVIFDSEEKDSERLKSRIESELQRVLHFDIPVILRTKEELEEIVERNPFEEAGINEKLYVSLLSRAPSAEAVAKLETYENEIDTFRIQDREVYVLCRENYGKSQFSNNFMEKKLGVSATTRNWATVNKLIQLAGERS
jgi:uncharacterized protein (DUF1697 family)